MAPVPKSLHWPKINENIGIKFFLSHTRSSQVHNQPWGTGWLVPIVWVSGKDICWPISTKFGTENIEKNMQHKKLMLCPHLTYIRNFDKSELCLEIERLLTTLKVLRYFRLISQSALRQFPNNSTWSPFSNLDVCTGLVTFKPVENHKPSLSPRSSPIFLG